MRRVRPGVAVLWLAAPLALTGCADPRLAELDDELAAIRANPGPTPSLELPDVPSYRVVAYQEADRRSPFLPRRPEPEPAPTGSGDLAPDPDRPREPLEAYSLEQLMLVGVLTIGGESWALVRAPGGEVHRLRVGHYLGSDHGRIVSITGSSLQLVERVPIGGGGWVERSTRLALDSQSTRPSRDRHNQ
jgi:type IV pilus assembly protein PilP